MRMRRRMASCPRICVRIPDSWQRLDGPCRKPSCCRSARVRAWVGQAVVRWRQWKASACSVQLSWQTFPPSRCAPSRTTSTRPTVDGGASTRRSPSCARACRCCSQSSRGEPRLAARRCTCTRGDRSGGRADRLFQQREHASVPSFRGSDLASAQRRRDASLRGGLPERAACFFAIDEQQRLVGALRLGPAKGISTAAPLQDDVALRTQRGVYTLDLRTGRLRFGGLAPFPSDTLTATDDSHRVLYVTQRGLLGFRVLDSHSGRQLYVVHYRGFTWNRRFGPV